MLLELEKLHCRVQAILDSEDPINAVGKPRSAKSPRLIAVQGINRAALNIIWKFEGGRVAHVCRTLDLADETRLS